MQVESEDNNNDNRDDKDNNNDNAVKTSVCDQQARKTIRTNS